MRTQTKRMVLAAGATCLLLLAGCQAHASARSTALVRPHSATFPSRLHVSLTATAPATASVTASLTSAASLNSSPTTAVAPAWTVAPLRHPIATLPQPLPARTLTHPQNLPVPVLMYHVIGKAPRGASDPDLYVTPKEFVAQMTYLSKHGYHAVTLKQVYDYWHGKATLPSKPIVLSFDDGDMPDFLIVAPLLKELHWPGVLNLISGSKSHLRLKKKIVRALIAEGWEIDSHTVSHVEVPQLSGSQLRFQIGQSRKRLQEWYGVPVDFFCYPYGRFNAKSIAAVKAAGYLGATTTRGGLARPGEIWQMRRVRVSGGLSQKSFARLLKTAR
jgi:peptidoglycan/xylan/chitin deacetylase (PgdA/CDA1 family)